MRHKRRISHLAKRRRAGNTRCRALLAEKLEDRCLLAALTFHANEYRDSSLLVQFRDPAAARVNLTGTSLGESWDVAPNIREVKLAAGIDIDAAIRAYQADPNVQFAEPDFRVSLLAEPTDDQFFRQWDMHNAGTSGGTEDADIDAPEAWDVTTGSHDVIVAVIDTGVDYKHPDLAANIWTNPGEIPGNKKDDDGNGYVDDVHGYDFANKDGDPMDDHFHGTHVAGTIGAVGGNDIGIAGVNWQVQIMALKFLDSGGGGYASDAIAALNYAVANGAVVSNNSWGGGGFSQAMQTAIRNAESNGHIFVAAAGNEGSNNDFAPFYPAGYDVANVVSVAASTIKDKLAWFSNFGKRTVDIAAPGQDIYSTLPTKVTPAMASSGLPAMYGSLSGTSMAAPHVTGVIALVKALHPDWGYSEIIDQILNTVDPVEGLDVTVTGGRLNAAGALGNAPPPPPDSSSPRITASDPTGNVRAPVSAVNVTFSERIDPTTFDLSDVVSFDGPDGPIAVTGLTQVGSANSRVFRLTFGEQVTPGPYSLVVGPDISDLSGNVLDQDQDGFGGEFFDDRYTATFTISTSVGYISEDVPVLIGDPWLVPIGSTLYVPDDITIGDLNIQINVYYPFLEDLYIELESPSGNMVTLAGFSGQGSDYSDTIFDDDADSSISDGYGPYSGTYRPDGVLADFNGQSAQGVWTLWITTIPLSATDSIGALNSWSLEINGSGGSPGDPPPPPPPPPDDNDPPVAVDDFLIGKVNEPLSINVGELLANDFDPDGDTLTITFVGNNQGGTVSKSTSGVIQFIPDAGYVGISKFDYQVSDGEFSDIGSVTIDFQAEFQWHNYKNALDVNNDGSVSPIDALLLITLINGSGGTGEILFPTVPIKPTYYYDVIPDNKIAPQDLLMVVNYINSSPASLAEQSAAVSTTAALAAVAVPAESSATATAASPVLDEVHDFVAGLLDAAPALTVPPAVADKFQQVADAVDRILTADDAIDQLLQELQALKPNRRRLFA